MSEGLNPKSSVSGQDASTGLFVSVYLLLFAFFVVLNSISNQKVARVGAAIESINSSFSKQFSPPADAIDIISDPEAVAPADPFLADVQGLLSSVLVIDGRFTSTGGNSLEAEIDLTSVFQGNSSDFSPEFYQFLEAVVSLILSREAGERREIEFLFPEPSTGQRRIYIERASRIAQELLNRDVPPTAITVGFRGQSGNRVRAVFRSLEGSRAGLTFSEFGEGRR